LNTHSTINGSLAAIRRLISIIITPLTGMLLLAAMTWLADFLAALLLAWEALLLLVAAPLWDGSIPFPSGTE
jgi:hypothetical protein